MLDQANTEIAGLREQVKTEKELRETAKRLSYDFEKSLIQCTDNLEKIETAFAEEKTTLVQCAEDAESKLKPVAQELRTLKGHITQMCISIFGKHAAFLFPFQPTIITL